MGEILRQIHGLVWGPPLVALLSLAALNLSGLLRGLQLRRLPAAVWLALIRRREPDGEGDVSHFQALMTALSTTLGTGNLVGVAVAIGAGGPGALFWMWVAGLLGMATKYAEAVLGVRFRETDQRGEKAGGPMYYLEHGLGGGTLGRGLAVAFAACAAAAAFGVGSGVPARAVADVVNGALGTPHWLVGIIVAAAAGAVILGGIRHIGRFAGAFIPALVLLYLAGVGALLAGNADRIPAAFRLILDGAFGGRAAAGGALGYTVLQAVRFGAARGLLWSEAGLGTGGIAAAAARTREPVRQALVSMTQTLIDTLVVCTLTGLAILVTGAWTSGAAGAEMTRRAFETGLPGPWGGWLITGALALFGFGTMIGWAYYGERSLYYLAGDRVIRPYRLAFVLVAALSALVRLDVVWLVSEILYGLMAIPNLIGLALLAGIVRRETRSYFGRRGPEAAGNGGGYADDPT